MQSGFEREAKIARFYEEKRRSRVERRERFLRAGCEYLVGLSDKFDFFGLFLERYEVAFGLFRFESAAQRFCGIDEHTDEDNYAEYRAVGEDEACGEHSIRIIRRNDQRRIRQRGQGIVRTSEV